MKNYDVWKTRSPDDERPPDEYEDQPEEEMSDTKQRIEARGEVITMAAHILISLVRGVERSEGGRSTSSELELSIDLTGGGVETWTITIERTASSH